MLISVPLQILVPLPSLSEGNQADIPIVVPPMAEQRAIAAFLDRETAQTDALVAKKQRLIDLLHEKRTALIIERRHPRPRPERRR